MRARAGFRGAVVAAALLHFGTSARAAEPPAPLIEFDWDVTAGCPDKEWATRAVTAYLGPRAARARTTVRVTIREHPLRRSRYVARIATEGQGGSGERTFDGATCTSVAKAATLVVAIAVDPETVSNRVHVPEPSTELGAGLAVSGDVGSLPDPTLGAGAFFAFRSGPASVDVRGLAWLPRLESKGPRAGTGGMISLYSGALRGCWTALDLGAGDVAACLTAEAGLMTGRGVNLLIPESSHGFWMAGLAGFVLRSRLGPLRPWISVDAGTPFVRPTFEIEGFGDVFRSSSLIGRASFAVAWIFP